MWGLDQVILLQLGSYSLLLSNCWLTSPEVICLSNLAHVVRQFARNFVKRPNVSKAPQLTIVIRWNRSFRHVSSRSGKEIKYQGNSSTLLSFYLYLRLSPLNFGSNMNAGTSLKLSRLGKPVHQKPAEESRMRAVTCRLLATPFHLLHLPSMIQNIIYPSAQHDSQVRRRPILCMVDDIWSHG